MLRHVPNLRRVAVSPLARVAERPEAMSKDHVVSYGPGPADAVGQRWGPDRVRAILTQHVTAWKACDTDIT